MTISEFMFDRLGRTLLRIAYLLAAAAFLLATGTQPGIITLLLVVCLLIFLLSQLSEYLRTKRRLE